MRDHVILRLGVVVCENKLALWAVNRFRHWIHLVANCEHLCLGWVVIKTIDDISDSWSCLAIFASEDIRVAEELDELAGEVDERGVVGLVHPRREEPIWTRR